MQGAPTWPFHAHSHHLPTSLSAQNLARVLTFSTTRHRSSKLVVTALLPESLSKSSLWGGFTHFSQLFLGYQLCLELGAPAQLTQGFSFYW